MMRHNEEGLVRQLCDAGAVGESSSRAPPPRTSKQSATRLECGEPGLKANKRRTLCTTSSATTLRKMEGRLELRCTRILWYCRLAKWRLYPRSHQRRPRSRARPCPEKSIEPAFHDSVSTPGANLNVLNSRASSGPRCGYRRVDAGRREILRIGKVCCGRALRTSCRTLP